jgi:ABC-type maltose transport system permease subunit
VTKSLKSAEQMVADLIESANRSHTEAVWAYELTSDVENIDVVSYACTHTLRIHPCWLRYVVAQGEFTSCVADEIEAWYLLERLIGPVHSAA